MKKIVILTTSLLLVSGGINATETLNKLVDKKIEQTTATMEASLPSVPGSALKAIWKIIKTASKLIDELPYNVIAKNIGVSINDAMEMSVDETVGKALLKDLSDLNIKVADNFDIGIMGLRARKLLIAMDENAIKTKKNIKSLQSLTRSDVEFIKAKNILKENPDITLDELALKVRKEIIEENDGKKSNLVFMIIGSSSNEEDNLVKIKKPKPKFKLEEKDKALDEMEKIHYSQVDDVKVYMEDWGFNRPKIKNLQTIIDENPNKTIRENYIFFTKECNWIVENGNGRKSSYKILRKFLALDFLTISRKELMEKGFLVDFINEKPTGRIILIHNGDSWAIRLNIDNKAKRVIFEQIDGVE